jgi:hypothetical protein
VFIRHNLVARVEIGLCPLIIGRGDRPLIDPNGETNILKRKKSSATIVADVT